MSCKIYSPCGHMCQFHCFISKARSSLSHQASIAVCNWLTDRLTDRPTDRPTNQPYADSNIPWGIIISYYLLHLYYTAQPNLVLYPKIVIDEAYGVTILLYFNCQCLIARVHSEDRVNCTPNWSHIHTAFNRLTGTKHVTFGRATESRYRKQTSAFCQEKYSAFFPVTVDW